MKKLISIIMVMSLILCLFAGCGSKAADEEVTETTDPASVVVGRWAADNLDVKESIGFDSFYYFDMNLAKDGTGDYNNGTHYSDGSGVTGTTRPLTWTLEDNIVTCTLETSKGNEIIKFEYTEKNSEQGGVATLKFLSGDYEGKYLLAAEAGQNPEDIFDLPETTVKEHTEEPKAIDIDTLLNMSYSEYKDTDYYFYIRVSEATAYMVTGDIYGNADFTGTYFKDTSFPIGSIRDKIGDAEAGSEYVISASVIYCSESGLSLSVFDAAPID